MADWKQQYLEALQARDEKEGAQVALYNKYTKLANKNAALNSELRKLKKASGAATETTTATAPPTPLVSYGWGRQTSPAPVPESATLAKLRAEFVKAQSDRAELQQRVDNLQKDVEAHQAKAKLDQRKIAQLTTANTQLSTKVRDREEELRGKAKLLVDVQDENVTLNLQLNVAEEQSKKLRKENQDLVDRWMDRKGKEADEMNRAGKFH